MEATIDSAGRLLIPKSLRESLGITAGTKVQISAYGNGLQVTVDSPTAKLVRNGHGRLVGTGDSMVTDEIIHAIQDAGRK